MSLSYSPVPYAPMSSTSAPPHVIRLLIPMPIPRTPNAPYFDERGVRAFLTLILQHGSCAGITDADKLVSFIVRYSSDRVRAIIQYIPELDEDTPNRTWSAAEQQMLLLYGFSDEERRVSEQELLDFCREHSAKSPFRSKLEVEQYLRSFQLIAAPLLKQQDITIAQRDYYFVSGIPSVIKNWFIVRAPESQRTRSNPVSLADTLGILYGYFDTDALFPDLWNELGDFSEPAEPLAAPTTHRMVPCPALPVSSAPFYSGIRLSTRPALLAPSQDLSSVPSLPKTEAAPDSSPASSTSSPLQSELSNARKPKKVHWDLDNAADLDQDFTAHEQFEVSPSDGEPFEDITESGECEPDFVEYLYKGSAVDSCEEYPITDRISGFCWALNELKHLAMHQDVDQASVADIASGVQAELEQCLTSASCGYVGIQISSHSSFKDNDSGSVSEMTTDVLKPTDPWTIPTEIDDDYERYLAGGYDDIELSFSDTLEVSDSGNITESDSSSIFDSATEFDAESMQSSYSEPDDTDHTFDIGKVSFPSDVQVPKLVESSHRTQSIAVFDPIPHALSHSLSYEDFDAVFQPEGALLEHANVQEFETPKFDLEAILELYTFVEPSQLSIPPPIACFDPFSEPDSVTDLFLGLFYNEKNAYNFSAPFPNDESGLVTISESADIPELSCFSFYTGQKSSELSAVFTNDEQDLNTSYEPAETNELSHIPPYTHLSAHSEPQSFTDQFLEPFSAEQKYSEPISAYTSDEQDMESIYNLYFCTQRSELSCFIHSPTYSGSESTADLFLELSYIEQNLPESRAASTDDEYDLELIYETYYNAEFSELSSHSTFIHSTSDSEPASITDMFIELILSQETSQGIDSDIIAPTSERDLSPSTHANFDEDLCTIFELYPEQHEYLSRAEPSKRAESQPFFLRTSYVHDFVPKLLISRTESEAFIEPTDDPPSYQESILVPEQSFAYTRPRIRAESFMHLLFHLFFIALSIFLAVLQRFYPLIVSFFSKLQANHNFETMPQSYLILKRDLHGVHPTENQDSKQRSRSIYTKTFIPAEPHPSDKHLHFISPLIPHFPIFLSIPVLKPSFSQDFEGEIQSTPLCGSTTRLARRLRFPSQLDIQTKYFTTMHPDFVFPFHLFLIPYFTCTHILILISLIRHADIISLALRTANAKSSTRVHGFLGLRRGSSRRQLGHLLVNV
ncbi:hypothetical protein B0H19DRAFT_1148076 [Mycena capillaripes]|nr:hypothetical protein B0H19DRAFT_1148076 [Mycena capillaripes]